MVPVQCGPLGVQLAPPFISTEAEVDRLVDALGETPRGLA